jgi:hypothetical protein
MKDGWVAGQNFFGMSRCRCLLGVDRVRGERVLW